ncbi:cytidine deaminase-like protein [Tilletiaria anomala UBC 951]|uniref:Cytidine deaminase-like protein n=1 Tax=Tilletiaria anomala (strain ATCC 24038 / CBS 436.72 / UBC 951) TaxID=1037660 RepID=A0A066W3A4_TILAU|nr:cytidine deaminase-like protein [Tilletiaria anomala UBC 951]KDN48206.1 cytidine deaminase-like protein [Tilletiaria anomala UBC 951]
MAEEALGAFEVPVGSVFVRNGEIIAKGRNRTNELMNATRHAELEAIDEILKRYPPQAPNFPLQPHSGPPGDNVLKETTLYVTVEPCIMCGSALRQAGIKRVVFGAGNERFGGNGSVLGTHDDQELGSAPPYEAVGGYYREEAILLLRRFYLTENSNAPIPKNKAKRVLKTEIQPPGISMHAPVAQQKAKQVAQSVDDDHIAAAPGGTVGGTDDAPKS